MQVVAVALEELVGGDAHGDDEVAGRRALHARLAEAVDAQLLAVADALGHLHRDALAVGHAALALALGARVVDDRAGAVAGWHVVADCMSPRKVCCTVTTRPVPWHSSQVTSLPSSPRPVPSQSGHGARRS